MWRQRLHRGGASHGVRPRSASRTIRQHRAPQSGDAGGWMRSGRFLGQSSLPAMDSLAQTLCHRSGTCRRCLHISRALLVSRAGPGRCSRRHWPAPHVRHLGATPLTQPTSIRACCPKFDRPLPEVNSFMCVDSSVWVVSGVDRTAHQRSFRLRIGFESRRERENWRGYRCLSAKCCGIDPDSGLGSNSRCSLSSRPQRVAQHRSQRRRNNLDIYIYIYVELGPNLVDS